MESKVTRRQLTLLKFEPQEVLFRDNLTRKVFKYEEPQSPQSTPIQSSLILEAHPMGSGFLYQKELTTLSKQLCIRMNSSSSNCFSETQICNTFDPIIKFLAEVREYGALRAESILVNHEGEVRLKDPRILSKNGPLNFEALGLVILQTALLINFQEALKMQKTKQTLSNKLRNYSSRFVANLWILLNNFDNIVELAQAMGEEPKSKEHEKIVEQIEVLRRSETEKLEGKKTICIPPLNFNLNVHKRKPELKLVGLSAKKRSHNENLNEECCAKMYDKSNVLKKILNGKKAENAPKRKVEANESPKKRGKTIERKY